MHKREGYISDSNWLTHRKLLDNIIIILVTVKPNNLSIPESRGERGRVGWWEA